MFYNALHIWECPLFVGLPSPASAAEVEAPEISTEPTLQLGGEF